MFHQIAPGPTIFWIYLICSFGLVLLGGLMSGLTVGFMSIDRLKLEVLKEAGTEVCSRTPYKSMYMVFIYSEIVLM